MQLTDVFHIQDRGKIRKSGSHLIIPPFYVVVDIVF